MTSEELKNIKFEISEDFINNYKDKQPQWGPVGYFTFKRTYARKIENENRTEEFWETLRRVINAVFTTQKRHCISLGLPWSDEEAQRSAQKMFIKMWNFKFLPSGRGMWIFGTPFVDRHGSAALNNCAFVSTHDIDIKLTKAFEFTMDMLMVGVGVGFDTKGAGKITIKYPKNFHKNERFKFIVPDSREGWVEALKYLLLSFFEGKPYPEFDFSLIRAKGLPIKGFGGVASGPEPLEYMLNAISNILMDKIGEPITSVDIVDIMNYIAKCVIAGNVRRSSEIALGDPDDKAYITMKDPVLHKIELEDMRWASNNSILCNVGYDYSRSVAGIKKNGEPGFIWLENARAYGRMCEPPNWVDEKVMGVNPCAEQSLESFELCCLCETFPSLHESYEEYQETLKYAYMYAKTVTLINTSWPETNAVMLRNRRLGISQSGVIDAFEKHGRKNMKEWCDKGYLYLKMKDKQYSDWLCVPRSIKLTSIKPSGTISLLPGVSPGIHYPHSKYYIRRIRISDNSSLVPIMRNAGYHIEEDLVSMNTLVISFPIKSNYYNKGKADVSIWEQFENAALYQRYWADNQVSITVSFKEHEKDSIKDALEYFEDRLKGISFLPLDNNTYKQMPYEEITEEKYIEMSSKLKPYNLSKTDDVSVGESYCTNDSCTIIKPKPAKEDQSKSKVKKTKTKKLTGLDTFNIK